MPPTAVKKDEDNTVFAELQSVTQRLRELRQGLAWSETTPKADPPPSPPSKPKAGRRAQQRPLTDGLPAQYHVPMRGLGYPHVHHPEYVPAYHTAQYPLDHPTGYPVSYPVSYPAVHQHRSATAEHNRCSSVEPHVGHGCHPDPYPRSASAEPFLSKGTRGVDHGVLSRVKDLRAALEVRGERRLVQCVEEVAKHLDHKVPTAIPVATAVAPPPSPPRPPPSPPPPPPPAPTLPPEVTEKIQSMLERMTKQIDEATAAVPSPKLPEADSQLHEMDVELLRLQKQLQINKVKRELHEARPPTPPPQEADLPPVAGVDSLPERYTPWAGMVVFFDSVSGLPPRPPPVRIVYAVYDGSTPLTASRELPASTTTGVMCDPVGGTWRTLSQKRRITKVPPRDSVRLVFEVQLVNGEATTPHGWGVVPLFSAGDLYCGAFEAPLFYSPINSATPLERMGTAHTRLANPPSSLFLRLVLPHNVLSETALPPASVKHHLHPAYHPESSPPSPSPTTLPPSPVPVMRTPPPSLPPIDDSSIDTAFAVASAVVICLTAWVAVERSSPPPSPPAGLVLQIPSPQPAVRVEKETVVITVKLLTAVPPLTTLTLCNLTSSNADLFSRVAKWTPEPHTDTFTFPPFEHTLSSFGHSPLLLPAGSSSSPQPPSLPFLLVEAWGGVPFALTHQRYAIISLAPVIADYSSKGGEVHTVTAFAKYKGSPVQLHDLLFPESPQCSPRGSHPDGAKLSITVGGPKKRRKQPSPQLHPTEVIEVASDGSSDSEGREGVVGEAGPSTREPEGPQRREKRERKGEEKDAVPLWVEGGPSPSSVVLGEGDGFDVVIVKGRWFPLNVRASKVVATLYQENGKKGYQPVGNPLVAVQHLTSDVFHPQFGAMGQLRARSKWKESLFCLIEVHASDSTRGGECCLMGAAVLPLLHLTDSGDLAVWAGSQQLRIHCAPLPTKAISPAMLEGTPVVPLATLLVTVRHVSASQQSVASWLPGVGNHALTSDLRYSNGTYHTAPCKPAESEVKVWKSRCSLPPLSVNTTFERDIATGGITDPKALQQHIEKVLAKPTGGVFDYGCMNLYSPTSGVAVRVLQGRGLPSRAVSGRRMVKVVMSTFPKLVQLHGVCTAVHDWGADIAFPRWDDPPTIFSGLEWNEYAMLVFQLVQITLPDPPGEVEAKSTVEPLAWTAMHIFTQRSFARHGTYTLPLYQGSADSTVLQSALTRSLDTAITASRTTLLMKWASLVVTVTDGLRAGEGLAVRSVPLLPPLLAHKYPDNPRSVTRVTSTVYDVVKFAEDGNTAIHYHFKKEGITLQKAGCTVAPPDPASFRRTPSSRAGSQRTLQRTGSGQPGPTQRHGTPLQRGNSRRLRGEGGETLSPWFQPSVLRSTSRGQSMRGSMRGTMRGSMRLGSMREVRVSLQKDPRGRVGLSYQGNEVTAVVPGGPGDRAGLFPGMLILTIAGRRVDPSTDAVNVAFARAPAVFDITVAVPQTDGAA